MNPKEPCPVCASLSVRQPFALPTSRGVRHWSRCPKCHSYFDCQPFDLESEVSHTRKWPWGNIEQGLQFNTSKRILYISILRLLNRFAASGSTLLDVGCSYGGFMAEARKQGYSASGMDIVPEAADYCRSQGFRCKVGVSVGDLDIADSSLDVVSVLDCNYYWPNQIRELRAIQNKLSSNGLLAMRVVDKSWMLTAGLALRRSFPNLSKKICTRAVNDHRVSIPVKSLLRVLRQEQFAILYASPAGALHHDDASLSVKAAFALGYLVWLVSRQYARAWVLDSRKETTNMIPRHAPPFALPNLLSVICRSSDVDQTAWRSLAPRNSG